MTTPQDQVPPPPKGYPSWLDYATEGPLSFSIHARAELAALRKELSDAKAERDERTMRYWSAAEERDAARKELSDTQGLLANARENLVAIDAQRAEAVRERDAAIAEDTDLLNAAHKAMHEANQELDALRAQVAELREAILELGELGCAYADGNELYLTDWNAQVAKLRAERKAKHAVEQALDETQAALAGATTRQCYVDREKAEHERDALRDQVAELSAAAGDILLSFTTETECRIPHHQVERLFKAVHGKDAKTPWEEGGKER